MPEKLRDVANNRQVITLDNLSRFKENCDSNYRLFRHTVKVNCDSAIYGPFYFCIYSHDPNPINTLEKLTRQLFTGTTGSQMVQQTFVTAFGTLNQKQLSIGLITIIYADFNIPQVVLGFNGLDGATGIGDSYTFGSYENSHIVDAVFEE